MVVEAAEAAVLAKLLGGAPTDVVSERMAPAAQAVVELTEPPCSPAELPGSDATTLELLDLTLLTGACATELEEQRVALGAAGAGLIDLALEHGSAVNDATSKAAPEQRDALAAALSALGEEFEPATESSGSEAVTIATATEHLQSSTVDAAGTYVSAATAALESHRAHEAAEQGQPEYTAPNGEKKAIGSAPGAPAVVEQPAEEATAGTGTGGNGGSGGGKVGGSNAGSSSNGSSGGGSSSGGGGGSTGGGGSSAGGGGSSGGGGTSNPAPQPPRVDPKPPAPSYTSAQAVAAVQNTYGGTQGTGGHDCDKTNYGTFAAGNTPPPPVKYDGAKFHFTAGALGDGSGGWVDYWACWY